jgi:CubicO group peptidase (beta-lactamase class C family)
MKKVCHLITQEKIKQYFKKCASIFLIILFVQPIYATESSDTKIRKNLEHHLATQAKQGMFSGSVLIAKNDKVIFEGAYGLASREYNVRNQLDTKFNLASIGKLFTSVAIAQLAQEGKLSLSDPINKYLSDWLPNDIAKQITIQQLLIHSSGLGSFFDNKQFQLGDSSRFYIEINDYKPLMQTEKLAFKPGSSQLYSNTGYLLLGAIIEKVSGQNYFEYVKQHIFKPAGMMNSDYYEMDIPTSNLAIGYAPYQVNGKTLWRNNLYTNVLKGSPAGGGFSTAKDMFKFAVALRTNKLLNPYYTQLVLSTQIAKPNDTTYYFKKTIPVHGVKYLATFSQYGFAGAWNSYGFAVWDSPPMIGHTGGTSGIDDYFGMSPENGYTIVILSNQTGSGRMDALHEIQKLLSFPIQSLNL